ncbi:type I-E CRISPR-associated protein Cse2/CasB [Streptomyces albidoflavus]
MPLPPHLAAMHRPEQLTTWFSAQMDADNEQERHAFALQRKALRRRPGQAWNSVQTDLAVKLGGGVSSAEEVVVGVAGLMVRFHRGGSDARYRPGSGDAGAAVRRLGDGLRSGPDSPGAERLLGGLLRSGGRRPWRPLYKLIDSLDHQNRQPPDWQLLIQDLLSWDRDVKKRWAEEFYTYERKA